MARIVEEGAGVLVYLRGHEGRGLGVSHTLAGAGVVDPAIDPAPVADSREYGVGAQILADLGVTRMRLMTNNPARYGGLEGFGLEIAERVGLDIQRAGASAERLMAEDVKGDAPPPVLDGAGLRIAIVAARFNSHVTLRLLDGARRGLAACGVADGDVTVTWVPGAFEIPLAAQAAALDADAVICLGCVIRGETAHFEHVAGQAAAGIMRVGLDTGKPVMFGVLTTEDLDQALARSMPEPGAHNVGFECAEVAVEMVGTSSAGARTRSVTDRTAAEASARRRDTRRDAYVVAMQVTVLGAGSWGTTVAALIAPRHPTVLWARNSDVAAEIDRDHTNAGVPPRVHAAGTADGDRRPREGDAPRRAAHRRRADDGDALDGAHGPRVDPSVDPDRQPVQGPRAGLAAADDRGHRRRGPRPPGRRAHRAEHRPRDHGRAGRGERDRHRRPEGRQGDPGRADPRPVPHLHEPRRHRLRARRRAEERRRHRLRDRPGPRRRRQHPGDGDDARPRRAEPPRRVDGRRGARRSPAWPAWATS